VRISPLANQPMFGFQDGAKAKIIFCVAYPALAGDETLHLFIFVLCACLEDRL